MMAIYARQSVVKADSISIESQIEFCKYEARGEDYKLYLDKGYSGKNTDRPNFQQMIEDIKHGLITKVIVYKLDRISRSILDFSNMMEIFNKYNVEFVSSTEKFDTSSPMGRAMLNICIVFAQLERETIQKRIIDAYKSRSDKGFFMGGRVPYGYDLEKIVIDGIHTQKYVINPQEAEQIQLIYKLYSNPQMSLNDIVIYLKEHNIINLRIGYWDFHRISEMLRNPTYVKADLDIYDYLKGKGSDLVNNPEDFIGINGCYWYTIDKKERRYDLSNKRIVIAPHEGIIDSETWITVYNKLVKNKQIQRPTKVKNSWLAGKLKCPKCNYNMTVRKWEGKVKTNRYFICNHHLVSKACEGVGGINADMLESVVLEQVKDKLLSLGELSQPMQIEQDNEQITKIKMDIENINIQIDSLLDKVANSDDALLKYINKRVKELDEPKKLLENDLSNITSKTQTFKKRIIAIENCVDKWDELSFEDKRNVADALIDVIYPDKNTIKIKWFI